MSARKLIAGLMGAAAIAGAVSLAAPANATSDEQYFLDLQEAHGYTFQHPDLYIGAAYQTCSQLNYETGDKVVPRLMQIDPRWSRARASQFMRDSVAALCPWHDHS
jgi:hypothetical protein